MCIRDRDEYYEIITEPDDFSKVREHLEQKGYEFMSAEIEMVPQNMTKLTDPKHIENMEKLIENLEDLDDCLLYTSIVEMGQKTYVTLDLQGKVIK